MSRAARAKQTTSDRRERVAGTASAAGGRRSIGQIKRHGNKRMALRGGQTHRPNRAPLRVYELEMRKCERDEGWRCEGVKVCMFVGIR